MSKYESSQGEGIMNYPVGEPTIGDPMGGYDGLHLWDDEYQYDPTAAYLRSIGALGDPRGEPIVLYPPDMAYLEKRIKELEKKIAKLEKVIDKKKRK